VQHIDGRYFCSSVAILFVEFKTISPSISRWMRGNFHATVSANKLHANSDTAARLVHAGYAVYGIDQEGHGKSSGSKGYISSFSDIVKDCANYFKSVCGKILLSL
jgi:pimeloyl-ACP methyl ester carboxylesterase